ncbi:MAG: trypsin-like peptidase domain-containing protein [Hyphomonadaceae bacterium]|nr:trypsin-like peptidase domain-containing protein [Hyphomonadaceae bacterium]
MDKNKKWWARIGLVIVVGAAIFIAAQPLRGMFGGGSNAVTSSPASQQEGRSDILQIESATIGLFERAAPSVVQVVSAQGPSFRGGMLTEGAESGSGFIWDGEGHVVTNEHVVRNSDNVVVRLSSGAIVEADVVGRAPSQDVAVLKLKRADNLPGPLARGQSGVLKVGQSVFAIGAPFGLEQSLTTGIISALQRRLPTSAGREIADVIQTDAAINPGNSGGPLLDSSGRVIGVNTAIFSPSGAYAGVGFAIPMDKVSRVVQQLIQTGRVPIPGIGIVAANEAAAARLGVTGLIVLEALPSGPAARSGLRGVDQYGRVGDIIVRANGEDVARLADLTDELERVGVGRDVALTVRRGTGTVSIRVPVVDIGER